MQSQTGLCKSHRCPRSAADEADLLVFARNSLSSPDSLSRFFPHFPSPNMKSTTSSLENLPTHRPSLPNELVDQILRDESLSKRDLANSCVVNHYFLESIQPLLYQEVAIWLVWNDESKRGLIKDQPRFLLRTLRDSPPLQEHVRKLNLSISYVVAEGDREGTEGGSSGFLDCGEILDEALKVMPRLDSLFVDDAIWDSDAGRNAVFARGERWKELSIRGNLFDGDSELSWSRLPNLKKLQCNSTGPQQTSKQAVPTSLEVLGTSFGPRLMEPVKVLPGCKLCSLRVVLTEDKLDHLALMQELQHLYIVTASGTGSPSSTTLESLSKLPSLRSLSIHSIDPDPDELANIYSLLKYLPPSITRLDFPDYVPFDFLVNLFKTDKLPHIRLLRVCKWYEESTSTPEAHRAGIGRLCRLCEEKGVAFEEHVVSQTHLSGML